MKKFVHKICFGQDSKLTVLMVLLIFAFAGLGCGTIKKALDEAQSNSKKDTKTGGPNSSGAPVSGSKDSSSSGNVSDAEVASLAQDTIQQFADAVEAEDFTEFRENVSTPFKEQFSPDAFKGAFNAFINVKKNVVPILRSTRKMTPTFSPEPAVSTEAGNRILDVNGRYQTTPLPTNFELQYVDEDGEWKLSKINIQVKN